MSKRGGDGDAALPIDVMEAKSQLRKIKRGAEAAIVSVRHGDWPKAVRDVRGLDFAAGRARRILRRRRDGRGDSPMPKPDPALLSPMAAVRVVLHRAGQVVTGVLCSGPRNRFVAELVDLCEDLRVDAVEFFGYGRKLASGGPEHDSIAAMYDEAEQTAGAVVRAEARRKGLE